LIRVQSADDSEDLDQEKVDLNEEPVTDKKDSSNTSELSDSTTKDSVPEQGVSETLAPTKAS
jgi:hypothetical protein